MSTKRFSAPVWSRLAGRSCASALEDLIIHKVIAGRPRDLEDVRTVLLKNPNADTAYIRQRLEEFERALAEPYRQRFEEIWKITRGGTSC